MVVIDSVNVKKHFAVPLFYATPSPLDPLRTAMFANVLRASNYMKKVLLYQVASRIMQYLFIALCFPLF